MGSDFRVLDRAWRLHIPVVFSVFLLALCFRLPARPSSLVAEYDRHDYPAAALDVLRNQKPSRIFTDDEWGDYLIYHLYPDYRVFIDGRSDFYGADLDRQQMDVINAHHDWQEKLSSYAIDTVLMRADAPLSGVLKESHNWSLVYDDGISTVFRIHQAGKLANPAGNGMHEKLSSVSPDVGRRLGAPKVPKPELQTLKTKRIERRSS